MEKITLILLSLFVISCSSTEEKQKLSPITYYKNDICVKEKNTKKKFCGSGVLKDLVKYEMDIYSKGKLNFFSITTCHEEDTTENPDRGIFNKNGKVEVDFEPTLEKEFACPMHISAYNKNQKHGFGFIAFENPEFTLEAIVRCNGYVYSANGVAVCETREGLMQRIEFGEMVKPFKPVDGPVPRKDPCPVILENDSTVVEFKLPPRECVYGFIGKKSGKEFKFFTIGYEDIIIRE